MIDEWRKFLIESKGVNSDSYPLQLFASSLPSKESLEKFKKSKKIIPKVEMVNKPMNAFWTSTAIKSGESYTSEWTEFSGDFIGSPKSFLLLKAKPDAKIFEVSSRKDYNSLKKEFGETKHPMLDDPMFRKLNWVDIAKVYDAVRITNEGAGKSREQGWLYGWDIESTAWFDPQKLEVIEAIDLKKRGK
jgi:hypothetical protein